MPKKKLAQLTAKATEKGQWALVAALTRAMEHEESVTDHINVLGAMHEVGLLRNSMAPLSKIWRDGKPEFVAVCVERLATGDADYWALAALLGLPIAEVAPVFLTAGFELQAITRVAAFKDPELHLARLAIRDTVSPTTLAPVVELGWNSKTGELLDVSRWRAVILRNQAGAPPHLWGNGSGSYYMRGKLPFGCWRVLHDEFTLQESDLVPVQETLWPK